MHASRKKTQFGIGIIEIMVAMLVSLLLLSGIIQIFINSKRAYTMTENLSRMQESARFAMNLLAQDLRMAGLIPCGRPASVANVLNGGTTNMMLDFFGAPLMGYEGGVSTFPAGFPAAGTTSGERVADADAVIIISGSGRDYKITSHQSGNSAQFQVTDVQGLQAGDILMACNNKNAAIFQVTNVNTTGGSNTVVHNPNQGNASPGNCTNLIGGNGDCANQAGITNATYDDQSQLAKLESSAYFVGVSSGGETRSLYRARLASGGAIQTEELLEGIETMQILYGVDIDNNTFPEVYMTADAVTAANNWNAVTSVRVGLLAVTPEEVHFESDTKVYNVAGALVGTSGATTHDADRRLRYVFSSTIKLRNRGTN